MCKPQTLPLHPDSVPTSLTSAPEQLRHPGSADFLHPTDATARARSAHYLEPRAILSDHPGATAGPHAAHAIEMAGRVIEETGGLRAALQADRGLSVSLIQRHIAAITALIGGLASTRRRLMRQRADRRRRTREAAQALLRHDQHSLKEIIDAGQAIDRCN